MRERGCYLKVLDLIVDIFYIAGSNFSKPGAAIFLLYIC